MNNNYYPVRTHFAYHTISDKKIKKTNPNFKSESEKFLIYIKSMSGTYDLISRPKEAIHDTNLTLVDRSQISELMKSDCIKKVDKEDYVIFSRFGAASRKWK